MGLSGLVLRIRVRRKWVPVKPGSAVLGERESFFLSGRAAGHNKTLMEDGKQSGMGGGLISKFVPPCFS